jgi:hypothetical protein
MPVGLHVVREARRAADPGDEDDSLAIGAELGHEALDDVEDRVVAAARAPADLLVDLKSFPAQLHEMFPLPSPSGVHQCGDRVRELGP